MTDSLDDPQRKLALWRYDYNTVRLHSSLGNRPLQMRDERWSNFFWLPPDALAKPTTKNMETKPADSH